MIGPEALFTALDFAMREAALFAAAGFIFLGAGDLLVDLIWIGLAARDRISGRKPLRAAEIGPPSQPGRLAIFVPAWDESDVIEAMLSHTLRRLRHKDFRLYVGCYSNDPAGIAAVGRVTDPRVRLVICPLPGPTTKADCLNQLWEAMLADESAEARRVKAVVLHDAEDVVDADELAIFDALIEQWDMVQLPVLPLIDENSRWVAGHYADEFAESHGKELIVRQAIGAGVPSAGVGCAFARDALAEIAASAGGCPFDAASLTEDYELGLKLAANGRRSAFARVLTDDGRHPVVTREYFPGTFGAAIGQKARWMTGIALSGWDRLGWRGGAAEAWMRLRDRQSVLAALLLAAGYGAGLLWMLLRLREILLGLEPEPVGPALALILQINLALLAWRLFFRAGFVARAYGWREGLRSVPRVVTGNIVAMCAARRAVARYRAIRRTGDTRWEKTAHAFPTKLPAE